MWFTPSCFTRRIAASWMSPERFMQSFGVSAPSARDRAGVAAEPAEFARLATPTACTSSLRDRFAFKVENPLFPKPGEPPHDLTSRRQLNSNAANHPGQESGASHVNH